MRTIFVNLPVKDLDVTRTWKDVMEAGPMYGGSFQDPDGHVWELMSMQA